MRRKRLLGLVCCLLLVSVFPLIFRSEFVKVANHLFSSIGGSSAMSSSAPTLSVDPASIVKDYELEPDYQIGKKFNVTLNITNVVELFSWQINITWNPLVLNVSRVIADEFLGRTTSVDKTSSYQLGFVINATDNTKGQTGIAESVLGDFPGITGYGILVKIEFLIVGYGWTELNFGPTGNLATTLLNSTGHVIELPPENVYNGWFDNRLRGDASGDKKVSITDWGVMSDHWTSPPGPLPYARYCDLNNDGRISITDWGIASDHWGRTIP